MVKMSTKNKQKSIIKLVKEDRKSDIKNTIRTISKSTMMQVDKNGLTPLHHFILKNWDDLTQKVLQNIDLDASAFDEQADTSMLHLAAQANSPAMINYLIAKYNYDPNLRNNNGETPLWVAACYGQSNALKALLENGGNPNLAANDNMSPIHTAVHNKHKKIIEILGKSRADLTLSYQGKTPLALALDNGYLKVAYTITKYEKTARAINYSTIKKSINQSKINVDKQSQSIEYFKKIINNIDLPNSTAKKAAGYALGREYTNLVPAFLRQMSDTIPSSMFRAILENQFNNMLTTVLEEGLVEDIETEQIRKIKNILKETDQYHYYRSLLSALMV